MSSALFKELVNIVGKECMKTLCEEYLMKYAIDNSGTRVWKDCSTETLEIYPKAWQTPKKTKLPLTEAPGAPVKESYSHPSPPTIIRLDINDMPND